MAHSFYAITESEVRLVEFDDGDEGWLLHAASATQLPPRKCGVSWALVRAEDEAAAREYAALWRSRRARDVSGLVASWAAVIEKCAQLGNE